MNDKSTSFNQKAPINCNGKILTFDYPRIMGVLNVTPDSFYDGGYYDRSDLALNRCLQMVEEGADIIDIGGVSTRPGSIPISVEEELFRVLPVLDSIKKEFPSIIVSVDTYHSEVARKVYEEGADMINDISGGTFDPLMMKTVAEAGLPYIIMHIQGTPANMQKNPEYENVVREVKEFLFGAAGEARSAGIANVIIDPGFGFGKDMEHNYLLLKNLRVFGEKGYPVLAGVSRKSMINRLLGTLPESALNGTTVANTLALLNGADILRVHDVKEAVQARDIVNYFEAL
jgi:dihydropteroate synthase